MFVGESLSSTSTRGGASGPNGSSLKTSSGGMLGGGIAKGADLLPKRETVQDLRGHVARIEERSRQLLLGATGASGSGASRVVRSVDALAEAGRAEVAAAARIARYGEGHASADVFLAQLGYNVEEQLRLLRQIEANRPVPRPPTSAHGDGGDSAAVAAGGVAAGGADRLGAGAAGGPVTQLSVAAFLNARRSAAMANLVADAHNRTLEKERDAVSAATAALWESRKHELAASIGQRNVLESTAGAVGGGASMTSKSILLPNASSHSATASAALLGGALSAATSRSAATASASRRAVKFARIVQSCSAAEWPSRFATAAAELAGSEHPSSPAASDAESLAKLWTTLNRVLSFQKVRGAANNTTSNPASARSPPPPAQPQHGPDVLRCVSASRTNLELRALENLYHAAHNTEPGSVSLADLRRMHPEKIKELLLESQAFGGGIFAQRGRGSVEASIGGAWSATYAALRCGRPDAAALVCPEADLAPIFHALAAASPAERHRFAAPGAQMERVAKLYRETSARDHFRAAVLVVLLAGDVGNDHDSSAAVQQLLVTVAATLDDLLWFRLALVRGVRAGDAAPATGRSALSTQTLEDLQRQLLSEQQTMLVSVSGDVASFVDLLLHACLFNTAVRMLADRPETTADAIHMALALRQHDLLDAPPHTETVFDLPSALQRHAVFLTRVPTSDAAVAAATLDYFVETQELPAFVELCATTPGIAVELFGRAGGAVGPLLKAGQYLTDRALSVALDVAEMAAANGSISIATDVLLSVHQAASQRAQVASPTDSTAAAAAGCGANVRAAAVRAVLRALELFNPTLCHRILKALSGVGNDIIDLGPTAEALRAAVQAHVNELPAEPVDTFQTLRNVASAVVSRESGNLEGALEAFFAIPCVPSSPESVAQAAESYNAAAEEARTVLPRALAAIVDVLIEYASQHASGDEARAYQLRQVALALCRWHGSWRTPGAGDAVAAIRRLASRFEL